MLCTDPKHISLAGTPQHHLDIADPIDAVGGQPRENGAPAASAREGQARAIAGLVAQPGSRGTWALRRRSGSSAQAFGRQSARSMKPCPWRET